MPSPDEVHFLLSLAVLLGTAAGFGQLARHVGLPVVVGEVLGGVCLGPTLLGTFAPSLGEALFPATGPLAEQRHGLVISGLLGFMFVAGLEIDLGRLRECRGAMIAVSLSSIAMPFGLGAGAALAWPGFFGSASDPLLHALFIGTALSISALPVIARTLIDLDLQRTALASLVLTAAMVDDVIGWTLFALLSRGGSGVGPSLLAAVVLITLALAVGPGIVRRWRPLVRAVVPSVAPRLALAAALAFFAAAITVGLGLHPAFGAFLAGILLSQGTHREDVHEICHAVGTGVLAPLYFVSIGLGTNLWRDVDVRLTVVVLVLACVGKFGGAALAGVLAGLPRRQVLGLGSALNARGAMEILLAGVARQQGLIDQRLFVALVIMAVVTSAASGPLLSHLVRDARTDAPVPAPLPTSENGRRQPTLESPNAG